MKRFALRIDDELCWGCKTCEAACKQEHRTPDDVKLIRVLEEGPELADGKWHYLFRVNRCLHCDEPPCVPACPVEAISKRADGIVVIDDALCTGCQECLSACPYNAIDFDGARNVAQKCNLCHHRVDQLLLPACADNVCLAHCIHLEELEEGST